jgi:hypothetical protein
MHVPDVVHAPVELAVRARVVAPHENRPLRHFTALRFLNLPDPLCLCLFACLDSVCRSVCSVCSGLCLFCQFGLCLSICLSGPCLFLCLDSVCLFVVALDVDQTL